MTERSGPSVVVAGGGSAGHIEPALALADAVCRLHPGARITALGTERGLDTKLIPARGYPLELIPPVPLPRRPSADLLRLPGRVRAAVARVRAVLAATAADVVVGFGGYVALPAYLGARGRVPIVVHEANARAGLANKVGARFAARVVAAALPGLVHAGIAVLHAHGPTGEPGPAMPGYVPLPYIDDMHLAYAAADAVLCRAGAMTVAEVSAVGLPAVYVPLPHGNGEQALNAAPVVDAGGGRLVDDADLTGERVLADLVPLLGDPARLAAMGAAARASGHADADERLARVVLDVVGAAR